MRIIDNYSLLNTQQESLLINEAGKPFSLGGYQSLDDILTSLDVDVIIDPGIITRSVPDALIAAKKYWKEEADHIESQIRDDQSKIEEYREAAKNRDIFRREIEVWGNMPLRGLYDPTNNVIKLYPEEMVQEYGGMCMDELLVSTLAHETMHAYFNRPLHKVFPYVVHIEEPLAEFGMLLYLQETGSNYYDWAYDDVRNKQTCYRLGARLMDQHLSPGRISAERQYLEEYKVKLTGYPMPIDSVNDTITLPMSNGRVPSPVTIGGSPIIPKWKKVFIWPPRYFYDPTTSTLGLDGDWSEWPRHIEIGAEYDSGEDSKIDISCNIGIRWSIGWLSYSFLKHIYLGANFEMGDDRSDLYYLLSASDVIVSRRNKHYYSNGGHVFYKKDNSPVVSKP